MQLCKRLSKEFLNMQLKLLSVAFVHCIFGASLLCLNANRQNMYLHNSGGFWVFCQSEMVTQHWNISIGSSEVNVGAVVPTLPILT